MSGTGSLATDVQKSLSLGAGTMSGTGSLATDVQRLISLDARALGRLDCGCGCACHAVERCCSCGGHPEWAGPSDAALKDRAKHLGPLIRAAKALLDAAQKALAEGATSAAEIRDMQRLEIWLGRLLVEEDRLSRKKGK